MATELTFDPIRLPPECEALRQEVRAFLAEEIDGRHLQSDTAAASTAPSATSSAARSAPRAGSA